jgi:hypothetical protein
MCFLFWQVKLNSYKLVLYETNHCPPSAFSSFVLQNVVFSSNVIFLFIKNSETLMVEWNYCAFFIYLSKAGSATIFKDFCPLEELIFHQS